MFTSSIKRHIRKFHVEVVQWTSKACTKNVIHEQSCCFAHKTDCFLSSSSWLLKLPNITSDIYVSLLARRGSDDDDDMQLHQRDQFSKRTVSFCFVEKNSNSNVITTQPVQGVQIVKRERNKDQILFSLLFFTLIAWPGICQGKTCQPFPLSSKHN